MTESTGNETRTTEVPGWASLEADEVVLWAGGPELEPYLLESRQSLVPIVLFGPVAIGALLVMQGGGQYAEAATVVALLAGILALGGVLGLGRDLSEWLGKEYLVTDQDVYVKSGVLSQSVTSVPVKEVRKTNLEQSPLGRKFTYGDVDLGTAATGGSEIRFRNIDDPGAVLELLDESGG